MRTVTATTTRTTAAHTALTDSATPIDPQDPALLAIRKADTIVMVFAITKPVNADVRTTETADVSNIIRLLKRLTLAQILADIMTSEPNDAFTISALVHTMPKTTNASSIGTQISQEQPAGLSTDITLTIEIRRMDDTSMHVTTT